MAKTINQTVYDNALVYIANNATRIIFGSAQVTAYSALSGVALISATLTTGSASVSFALTAGSGSEARRLTVKSITGMAALKAGTNTATYCHVDNGSAILFATTVNNNVIASGETWNSPAFNIDLNTVV